jgi:hypothetical protein
VLRSGLAWVRVPDDDGMRRLREFEQLAAAPYLGQLSADEQAVPYRETRP